MFSALKKQLKQINRKHLNVMSGAVVALAVITSVIVFGQTPKQQVFTEFDQPVAVNTTELLPEDLTNIKTISEIQAIANQVGKQIAGLELEYQDGILVFVVNYSDTTKNTYDAKTGLALEYKGDNNDNIEDEDRLPPNFSPATSIVEALTLAKQQNPNSAAKKIEVEVETSLTLYGIYFADSSKLFVSANNGNIVTIPDPEPIIYTASSSTPTQSPTSSTSTKKNTNWRDEWKQIKDDRRKKLEDYINSYYNRD